MNAVALPRAEGELRLSFARRGEATVIDELYQRGCAKARFPRLDPGEPMQAVTLNTAGGLTDGDDYCQSVHWGEDTRAVVTTQAAERVYRSRGSDAVVRNRLSVAAGARAVWLPQETILFNGGRLHRVLDVELAADASLWLAETWTLGRAAMGETVRSGALHDRWCIRRGGQPLWADALRFDSVRDGDLQRLTARPAVMNGARSLMTAVLVVADPGAVETCVENALSQGTVEAGVSRVGAVLVVRALAPDPYLLRATLHRLVDALQSADLPDNPLQHCAVPRVFDC